MKNYWDTWVFESKLGAEWWRVGCELAQTEWNYVLNALQADRHLWTHLDAPEETAARLACKRFARDLAFLHDISTEVLASQSRQWALVNDLAQGSIAAEMTENLPEFFEQQGKALSRALSEVGRAHGQMAFAYSVN